MKRLILVAAIFSLVIGGVATSQQPRSKIFKKLMDQKLKSSQKILEGLALNDFKKTATGAEDLLRISNTEEWFAYKTREYKLHSNEFRRAAEKLLKKSKEKNLDGAALAYMELTMTCIRCHEYVREVRDVRFDGKTPLQEVH